MARLIYLERLDLGCNEFYTLVSCVASVCSSSVVRSEDWVTCGDVVLIFERLDNN